MKAVRTKLMIIVELNQPSDFMWLMRSETKLAAASLMDMSSDYVCTCKYMYMYIYIYMYGKKVFDHNKAMMFTHQREKE